MLVNLLLCHGRLLPDSLGCFVSSKHCTTCAPRLLAGHVLNSMRAVSLSWLIRSALACLLPSPPAKQYLNGLTVGSDRRQGAALNLSQQQTDSDLHFHGELYWTELTFFIDTDGLASPLAKLN